MSLVNITSPEDAFILEHAISILTGSYVEYGGMNVKVGGDLGMLGIARNATNETWHNGMRALYAQDVFPQQVKAMKEDLAHLELWDKYKNEGSELRELAAAQAELVKAEEEAGQIALATKDKGKAPILEHKVFVLTPFKLSLSPRLWRSGQINIRSL